MSGLAMDIREHVMNSKRIYILIGLLTVPSASAFAYVDPGTGSMALQFLIGGLFAAALTIKTYYYKIKSTLTNLFGRTGKAGETEGSADDGDVTSQPLP